VRRRLPPPLPRRPQAATPIFGAASTFGAGTGFAGFTGLATAPAAASGAEGEEHDDAANPEEECKAEFKPVVQLEEVETSTGEEDEAPLLEMCARRAAAQCALIRAASAACAAAAGRPVQALA
jgi:hypothetical protein